MNKIEFVTIPVDELKKIIQDCIGKASEKEEILTTQQVADLLHVDRGTVYDYRDAGHLKAYGIGKRVWYKRSEVIAALVRINDKAA